MKLRDAIKFVDKSRENSNSADIDTFAQAVGINEYLGWAKAWDERVHSYWLIRWLCTDTWVGARVYFFDDVPIAIGSQSARKSPEEIEFLSKESADSIYNFIRELAEAQKSGCNIVSDLECELPDFYDFELTDYFLEKTGFVDGKPVKIVQREHWPDGKRSYICHHCEVMFEDGEVRVVTAKEVKFPLRVKVAATSEEGSNNEPE